MNDRKDPDPSARRLPPDADATVISAGDPAAGHGGSSALRGIAAPQVRSPTAEIGRLLEGSMLGCYRLDRFIGGGGMGAVFQALDTTLDRTVAVKVLARTAAADDEETLRRFRNEAQSAARLDHENIGRVHAVGSEGEWHFIVFEYIEGTNIRDLVREEGPFDAVRTIDVAIQVADALEHASQREIVHRDIKPSNIVMTPAGRARLVDMGLARLHQVGGDGDLTVSGMTLGTFDYISPEQARDPRAADVRSDLYSLGCTMFFMLVGRPPFAEGTMVQKLLQHQQAEPPAVDDLRPDVPHRLAAIIARLMAKDPLDRYQRPAVLAADLAAVAETEGYQLSVSRPTALPAAPPVAGSRLPWALPVAGLALLVAALWMRSTGSRRGGTDAEQAASEPAVASPGVVRVVASPSGAFERATVAEAIAASGAEGVVEIDVDGDVAMPAVGLATRRITIRPAAGRRPVLAIASGERGPAIDVGDGRLELEDLVVRVDPAGGPPGRHGLFAVGAGGLVCRRVVLMMPAGVSGESASESAGAFVTVTLASADEVASVEFDAVKAAGDATLLEVQAARGGRVDFRWSGGELATPRRLIAADGSGEPPGLVIGCRLVGVIAACGRGVVTLRDTPGQPVPPRLTAEVEGCRFVVVDPGRPFLEQSGIGLPDAYRDALVWRDREGRYEGSPVFWRADGAAERVEIGFGDATAPPFHDSAPGSLPDPDGWEAGRG